MKLVPRAKFQPKTRDFEPDSFVQYRLEIKNHVFTIFPELLSSPLISPILSLRKQPTGTISFLRVRGRPPESLLQLFNKWTGLNDFFFFARYATNLKIADLQSLNQWFLKLKILDLVNMTYWGFYVLFRDSRLYFETFG